MVATVPSRVAVHTAKSPTVMATSQENTVAATVLVDTVAAVASARARCSVEDGELTVARCDELLHYSDKATSYPKQRRVHSLG